jgi:hypothetical protein
MSKLYEFTLKKPDGTVKKITKIKHTPMDPEGFARIKKDYAPKGEILDYKDVTPKTEKG